jgi:hypothetical protein
VSFLLYIPALLQGLVIVVDELFYHRRRALPAWEIVGHPLDTLTVVACYAFLLFLPPSPERLTVFIVLAAFSTLFVTKDELVHAEQCAPGEHWLHSLLFILHPTAFFCSAQLWLSGSGAIFFAAQLALTSLFFLYQIFYWGIPWARTRQGR